MESKHGGSSPLTHLIVLTLLLDLPSSLGFIPGLKASWKHDALEEKAKAFPSHNLMELFEIERKESVKKVRLNSINDLEEHLREFENKVDISRRRRSPIDYDAFEEDDEVADEAPPVVEIPARKGDPASPPTPKSPFPPDVDEPLPEAEDDDDPPERIPKKRKSKGNGELRELDLIHGSHPKRDGPRPQISKNRLPPNLHSRKIEAAASESFALIASVAAAASSIKKAVALAKGVHNNVSAHAVSKIGQDAIAVATNGSSADALALTSGGNGSASSAASTFGIHGAKSAAISQGTGEATSAAASHGEGKAHSDSMAKANNATSSAKSGKGGALSNAIALEKGSASSTSAATDGGSAKSTATAKGKGRAIGVGHAVGGGNATAMTKAHDGNSESDSLAKDQGTAYSAAWAKKEGNSLSNAKTLGGGASRAESLADGEGKSTANAYQALNGSDSSTLDMDAVVDEFQVTNGMDALDEPFFHIESKNNVAPSLPIATPSPPIVTPSPPTVTPSPFNDHSFAWITGILLPSSLGFILSSSSKRGQNGRNDLDEKVALSKSAPGNSIETMEFYKIPIRRKRADYDDDYDEVAEDQEAPAPSVKGAAEPPPPPPPDDEPEPDLPPAPTIHKSKPIDDTEIDYDTTFDSNSAAFKPSSTNEEEKKPANPKGELISNAHSKDGESIAIALAKMGADATSNSLNGTGAISIAETKGRGVATSRADSYGQEGAKAKTIAKGHGASKSYAISRGEKGDSDTQSKAVGGNAIADSVSIRGTHAKSYAETSRAGNASSKSISTLGGNSTSAAFARGQGNSYATTWVDDMGFANSISKAKRGNAFANSLGLRDAKTHSIASSKKTGSALARTHTGIRGKGRSDATAAQGDAVAVSIQDSAQRLEVREFASRVNVRDFKSSEEVNEEEQDSEEPETVSEAAKRKKRAINTHIGLVRGTETMK
ncbi:unnamed protein product [Orchesella dallaii]|uniref:Uncharacterized protein n=1 Tax=Orchesella dallaii TaxID=48710 RepID=A0ABP1RH91_9HEXA